MAEQDVQREKYIQEKKSKGPTAAQILEQEENEESGGQTVGEQQTGGQTVGKQQTGGQTVGEQQTGGQTVGEQQTEGQTVGEQQTVKEIMGERKEPQMNGIEMTEIGGERREEEGLEDLPKDVLGRQ